MKLTLPNIGCHWLPFTRIRGHANTKTNKNTNHFLCAKPTIGIDRAKYWLPVVALHTNTWTHKFKNQQKQKSLSLCKTHYWY